MRWVWLLVFSSCAAPSYESVLPMPQRESLTPASSAVPVPDSADRACIDAMSETAQALTSPQLTGCEHDVDCRPVAPVVAGRCGVFVNAEAFEASRETFAATLAACDAAVQVVPRCVSQRAVCQAGRCVGDAVSESPDECTERKSAWLAKAVKRNGCSTDVQCVALEGGEATSVEFLRESAKDRDAMGLACGTVEDSLFTVPAQREDAFCVDGRRATARKFTTVVREPQITPPDFDHKCIIDAFFRVVSRAKTHKARLSLKSNLGLDGRMRQFEFLEPATLPVEAQAAFAAHLSTCRVGPARIKKKPTPIRWRLTILID